jgi:hypothetical protein
MRKRIRAKPSRLPKPSDDKDVAVLEGKFERASMEDGREPIPNRREGKYQSYSDHNGGRCFTLPRRIADIRIAHDFANYRFHHGSNLLIVPR